MTQPSDERELLPDKTELIFELCREIEQLPASPQQYKVGRIAWELRKEIVARPSG